MPTIRIENIDFYYELHGQGDPLVLIAGYACDHTYWGPMLDELAHHFKVLIFDNVGVGQTKDTGALLTLEAMANHTMLLIQQLELGRPHILGQSMGGAIAQIMARKYPDNINKLIILNSAAKFNVRSAMAMQTLLNLRKADVAFDCIVEASMPWFFSSNYLAIPGNITSFKEILENNPYPQSVQDQERQFKTIPSFDSLFWLNEIKAPTLVIAARDDIVALPKESQQLANGIRGAQCIEVQGGHSSPLEQPQELNKAILRFLTLH